MREFFGRWSIRAARNRNKNKKSLMHEFFSLSFFWGAGGGGGGWFISGLRRKYYRNILSFLMYGDIEQRGSQCVGHLFNFGRLGIGVEKVVGRPSGSLLLSIKGTSVLRCPPNPRPIVLSSPNKIEPTKRPKAKTDGFGIKSRDNHFLPPHNSNPSVRSET